jgi:hypothetical protein
MGRVYGPLDFSNNRAWRTKIARANFILEFYGVLSKVGKLKNSLYVRCLWSLRRFSKHIWHDRINPLSKTKMGSSAVPFDLFVALLFKDE